MGFICGIINFNGTPVKQEDISILTKSVGWDGFISHTQIDKHMAFGYCHHPKREAKAGLYADATLIVLADVRIYNQDLFNKDNSSPEEAIAKAYLHWGTSFVDHLNGDFAIVILDKKKNEFYLYRDHIGTRPLVYWQAGTQLIFASHEFGLMKSGLVPKKLSEEKIVDNFFKQELIYKQTVFRNIYKVIPGTFITFSEKKYCAPTVYWNPAKIKKNNELSFQQAAHALQKAMVSATVNRMEPGNIGLHVSGGIDSCGVASIVADHTPNKNLLTGYSWTPETFDDPVEGCNEKEFIEAFSEDKQIKVNYLSLEKYETVKNAIIPEFEKQHIEHPVMKMAEKNDIVSLFSGWGGDEFVSLSLRGTANHLFFTFKWLSLFKFFLKSGIKGSYSKFRVEILPLFIPFHFLPVYKAGKKDWSCLHLFKREFIQRNRTQIFLKKKKNIFGCNRTQFCLNLLHNYHLPERMESWAINAEKYGFEYKYPLLDKDVLNCWFSLPIEYTYKNFHSRLLYREAMKGILTEKIRIRKDKGEALRIAFSLKEGKEGRQYLHELFDSLSPDEHLPFCNPGEVLKTLDRPDLDLLNTIKNQHKYVLYLRYVLLVKKYI